MKRFLTGRILVMLALAGLMLAPVSVAVAVPMMTPHAMAGMPDSMDCCPKQQVPLPDCGKTCPFVALCLSSLGGLTADEVAFNFRTPTALSLRPGLETAFTSLVSEPPPRPPRI